MRHGIITNRQDATAEWESLSATTEILSVRITTVGAGLNMRFKGQAGFAVPAGRTFTLRSVDLSDIEISGGAGDAVIVAGGTW